MPHSASRRHRNTRPADVQALRHAAQHVAEALRTGSCSADRVFDRLLPDGLRVVSGKYWTPLVVAKRAAEWFDDVGVRTVVDIGSGAGKFCVVAALVGDCRFTGLEQRPSLVASARALARLFDLQDRVSFVEGALGVVAAPSAQAYYLYNPFGQYCFGSARYADAGVEFNDARFAHDVAAAEHLLWRAP
jgi:SAM-dependent methyltransferase